MTATMIPSEMLGLQQPLDAMEKTFAARYSGYLGEVPGELRARIEHGTATLDEVEAFVQQTSPVPDDLKTALLELLLVKKGWLSVRADDGQEALQTSNRALKTNDRSTSGWTLKATALVRLLSIKDPFDRWRELSKEISKVWPKGLSAVDAVREHRE